MVHLSNSYKIFENLFFFLFGFPDGFKPKQEENEEKDYDKSQVSHVYEHENIDHMMNDVLVVGDEDEIDIDPKNAEVEVPLNISDEDEIP